MRIENMEAINTANSSEVLCSARTGHFASC